jgi:DNA-binding LacI/PurR family transcriptional regulator
MLVDQIPTISDVAQRAGVSIATVSRVLNRSATVAPPTAEKVRSAIAELGFVPRSAARVLAGRKTHTLGLVLPEISSAFFPPLLRGIEAEARQAGYSLLIHALQDNSPPHLLGEHNSDGLLIFPDSLDRDELVYLHRRGFPLVLLNDTPPDDLPLPAVTIENKSGAEMLVKHLIRVHHRRRIAYLQGPPAHEDSRCRERGYCDSLVAHGIPFDPALIAMGGFDEDEAYLAVQHMLQQDINPDAIFAGDDDAAIGALRAVKQSGRRVPEDIAVVGFDDLPFAQYLTPPLTTVRAPIEQVGRAAVHQLLCLLHDQPAAPLTLLPTELVIRQSCGCGTDQT